MFLGVPTMNQVMLAHPTLSERDLSRHATPPNEQRGESILAAVVPRDDAVPERDDLREHLTAHVSRCKFPHLVVTVDAIPRNPSGKILKHVLREQLATDPPVAAP